MMSHALALIAGSKLKRMGLKLERLGKHLHETRAKLKKVEEEREKYRERCEALEWLTEVQEFYFLAFASRDGWDELSATYREAREAFTEATK